MPVDTVHKDYTCFKKEWDIVRSLKDSNAHEYIKDIDAADPERSKNTVKTPS